MVEFIFFISLREYTVDKIYYDIGIPDLEKEMDKSINHLIKIDFLLGVNEPGKVIIHYDLTSVFAGD